MKELGYTKGEVCGRDGCSGVIMQHDTDGGCSCHINPPCGYCTTPRDYCPVCKWEAIDDVVEAPKPTQAQRDQWDKDNREFAKSREDFYTKFRGTEAVEKLEYRRERHTHFSMEVIGVYPEGMNCAEIVAKIKGTFGGRFTMFGNGRFKYIAYTD